MPVSLTNMRNLLMPGLCMSPEERAAAKAKNDAEMAQKAAAETAKYNAMSQAERDEYDALTDGMMPRLPGVAERRAERYARGYRETARRG